MAFPKTYDYTFNRPIIIIPQDAPQCQIVGTWSASGTAEVEKEEWSQIVVQAARRRGLRGNPRDVLKMRPKITGVSTDSANMFKNACGEISGGTVSFTVTGVVTISGVVVDTFTGSGEGILQCAVSCSI